MKLQFKRFGDCVCYDSTYGVLRLRLGQKKQIGVGIFTGQDTNMRIVLLGMSIIAREDAESFQKLFTSYFDLM